MEDDSRGNVFEFISRPLLIGIFFSLYSFLVRFYVYPKYYPYLAPDSGLIQNFIEWFGVAYGLFIALVLVNVWAQYDSTEREFDREADAIFMLYESVRQIQDTTGDIASLRREIIQCIKDYVTHVTESYVAEHQNWKLRDQGDEILEAIRKRIGKLIHTDEKEAIISELVEEFNEAVDVRGDRISRSRQRIPNPVWGISLASSILWLIPFYGLDFQNDWIAISLVGGVTAIVVAILVIIRDLDDPFEGTWQIDIEEWRQLGEKIGLQPTLFFVCDLDSRPIYRMRDRLKKIGSRHLCALHKLLYAKYRPPHRRQGAARASGSKTIPGKDLILGKLAEQAYCRVVYKDEYARLYEEIDTLPAIIYKSKNKIELMLKPAEIRRAATPAALLKKILKKLGALRAVESPD